MFPVFGKSYLRNNFKFESEILQGFFPAKSYIYVKSSSAKDSVCYSHEKLIV